MYNSNYLSNSLNFQRLNELAKKYNLTNYVVGQSFDSVKDTMSNEDYETSQKLLNYYTNQESLTNDYNYNLNQLNQNRNKSLQENAISKELTQKYLPEYLKVQGMGGLGVSESSLISANNEFRNVRNTINANAQSSQAELLKNYQDSMASVDSMATDEANTIKNRYDEIAREEKANEENKKLEQNNTYTYILNSIYELGVDFDKAQLDDYLNMDAITKEQYNWLKDKYNTLVQTTDPSKFDTSEYDEAYKNNEITEEDLETQKSNWNKNIATDSTFFNYGDMSVADATELLNKTINNGWASDDTISKLKATYESCYGRVDTNSKLSGKSNSANDDKGDNFVIKVGDSKYKVEKGYDVSENVNSKLVDSYKTQTGKTSVPIGSVMVYEGKIYMYLNNNNKNRDIWCCVQARKTSYASHFRKLCEEMGVNTYKRNIKTK